jgi:hypothetical protein
MAKLFSQERAAPHSAAQEINELADTWVAFAVRDALEPDVDDILQKYLQLLSHLPVCKLDAPVARGEAMIAGVQSGTAISYAACSLTRAVVGCIIRPTQDRNVVNAKRRSIWRSAATGVEGPFSPHHERGSSPRLPVAAAGTRSMSDGDLAADGQDVRSTRPLVAQGFSVQAFRNRWITK